jgi:hypothetical protein
LQCLTDADSQCENLVGVNSPNVTFVLQHPSSSIDLSFSLTGWALDDCDTIDPFVSRNKDLHAFELSNTDWESISGAAVQF